MTLVEHRPSGDPFRDLADYALKLTPQQLERFAATLDADDLTLLERALGTAQVDKWRETPASFMEHVTDGRMTAYPYIELLASKFVDAVEGRSIRQIWNLPARFSKTSLSAIFGPAWALDRYPWLKFILADYVYDLSRESAVQIRDLLVGDDVRTRLLPDRKRADRFVTEAGGGVLAAGVGGRCAGFGCHGLILGDLFANWEEAHSEARRNLVYNWYRSVARLRLDSEDGFIIHAAYRVHEDDLAGRLLDPPDGEGEKWELVSLPQLAAENDPLGRAPGDVLEPARLSAAGVEARRISLGSYLFSSMELQSPSAEEGTEILRAWWRYDSAMPTRADDWCSSWDVKLKDKETGDFVVGGVWARTGPDYWLTDLVRGQWNFATTKAAVALVAVRHPAVRRHLIENSGNGPELIEELGRAAPTFVLSADIAGQLGMTEIERVAVETLMRRGMSGLIPVTPKLNKQIRARIVTPIIEAGNAHLPVGASWVPAFVDECASFPNGTHDDQVDMMSQALSRMSRTQSSHTSPKKAARRIGTSVAVATAAVPR